MSELFSDCPTWLDEEVWSAYKEWRAGLPKKQRATPYALKLILAELARLKAMGHNPTESLKQSMRAGWLDVFAPRNIQQAMQAPAPQAQAGLALTPAHQVLDAPMTGEQKRAELQKFRARMGMQ